MRICGLKRFVMAESWKEIAKRALDDWRVFHSLDESDQQMLYAFRSFSPPLASRKHLIAPATNLSIRLMMLEIGEPGGTWFEHIRIPFDESGKAYIQNHHDWQLFPEHFKWWSTSQNQEVLYDCGDRFDPNSFMAIIPAATPPEILKEIEGLSVQDFVQCQATFLQLLPMLRWIFILLRPRGDFGIFIPSQNFDNLLSRVEYKLRLRRQTVFKLTKAHDRVYWKGPTAL